MLVFSTDSLTNWCPQTSSSSALLVMSVCGARARAHSRANGLGARCTGWPPSLRRASASSISNRSNRTLSGGAVVEELVVMVVLVRLGDGYAFGSGRFASAERTHSQSSSGGTGLGRKQTTPALRARRRVVSSA